MIYTYEIDVIDYSQEKNITKKKQNLLLSRNALKSYKMSSVSDLIFGYSLLHVVFVILKT